MMVRFYIWLYREWPGFAARFQPVRELLERWFLYNPEVRREAYASPPSIEELIAAINTNATTARLLINSLLAVAVSLGAVIIATTDEALLYNRIAILPVANMTASPVTVYALAPLVVLFLHGMAILQLNLISRRMNVLEQVMAATIPDSAKRRGYRLMLSGFGFVQILIGEAEQRHVAAQRFMNWVATALIPVLLLLTMQISFVRYQHDAVTLLQQIVLGIDLLFLLGSYNLWNQMSRPRAWSGAAFWVMAGLLNVVLTAFAANISFFHAVPAEEGDDWRLVRYELVATGEAGLLESEEPKNLYLYGSCKKERKGLAIPNWNRNWLDIWFAPCMPWGRRYLKLDQRVLIDETRKPALIDHLPDDGMPRAGTKEMMLGLDLDHRNLRFAYFRDSRLQARVRLEGADLTKADLQKAWLPRARLAQVKLTGASLKSARLEGADLTRARLESAILWFAQLEGAFLDSARLEGASLQSANLEGISLEGAHLEGAELINANLVGANLKEAHLEGADLRIARLMGADLQATHLEGADLQLARLENAFLLDARLAGANGTSLSCNAIVPAKRKNVPSVWTRVAAQPVIERLKKVLAGPSIDPKRRAYAIARLENAVGRETKLHCETPSKAKLLDLKSPTEINHATAIRTLACKSRRATAKAIVRSSVNFYYVSGYRDGRSISLETQAIANYGEKRVLALGDALKNKPSCRGVQELPDKTKTGLRKAVERIKK